MSPYIIQDIAMHFRQDWLSDILLKQQFLKISFLHQSLHIQKLLGGSVN